MPELLARFSGTVSCHGATGAPGLMLTGVEADEPGGELAVSFSAVKAASLPATLTDARVESLGEGRYRIVSAAGTWELGARAVHLHREIASVFYRALPPRRVPWMKRAFLRLVLALAASRVALGVLRALRR